MGRLQLGARRWLLVGDVFRVPDVPVDVAPDARPQQHAEDEVADYELDATHEELEVPVGRVVEQLAECL
jgi:hypothetical protein